jgi:hypothetical protein
MISAISPQQPASTYLLEELLDDGRFAPARRDILETRLESAAGARIVLCGHSHRAADIDSSRPTRQECVAPAPCRPW